MQNTHTLFEDLEARGLVKQVTDPKLANALEKETFTLYCGFDPTADCLHVGSLLPLMTLRRFQQAGHRIVSVVGGATGMIGDPSGKSSERSLLDETQLQKNVEGIRAVISKFLPLEGKNPALVTNNANWFRSMTFLGFLRDVGKHFTVNHMLAKESVRSRLEDRDHGISYTEFSYMLLQAYDYYVLNREQNCRLQIGGSDQWGNITAGTELIRRMKSAQGIDTGENSECFGMTHPLVMKSDGTKFGKSETGTIWLNSSRTSVFKFFQFFIQTADADVGTFLKYFTFLSLDEIARLENTVHTAPEKREAQLTLAREVTRLVHGEEELAKAEKATQALFGTEINQLDATTLLEVFAEVPSTKKSPTLISAGISIVDLLAETGLCQSKGAARKDITSGGIYLNNERITDVQSILQSHHLIANTAAVLRKGKKNYHLILIDHHSA